MEYRLYFLGTDRKISGPACQFMALDDAEAVQKANAIFRAAILAHHGFEVWEGRRRVLAHNC